MIPSVAYRSNHRVMRDAFAMADMVIEGWRDALFDKEKVNDVLVGWGGVDLSERIISRWLEAQGYDLEDLYDAGQGDDRSTWGDEAGCFDAELERQRRIVEGVWSGVSVGREVTDG